jgi:hypothetical protein
MLRVRAATRRGGGQVLDIARGLWRWYDGWLVRDMIGNWVYYNGYSSGKAFCVDVVVNGRTCQVLGHVDYVRSIKPNPTYLDEQRTCGTIA